MASALARLAPASPKHFPFKELRDLIIRGLYALIAGPNSDAAEKALEALIEVARLNYEHFGECAPGHLQETARLVNKAKAARDPTDTSALLAVEVWNLLGEREHEFMK